MKRPGDSDRNGTDRNGTDLDGTDLDGRDGNAGTERVPDTGLAGDRDSARDGAESDGAETLRREPADGVPGRGKGADKRQARGSALSPREVLRLIVATYRTSLPYLLVLIAGLLLATWLLTELVF